MCVIFQLKCRGARHNVVESVCKIGSLRRFGKEDGFHDTISQCWNVVCVEEGSETEQRLIGGGGKTLAAQLDAIGSRALTQRSAAEFSVLRVISGNCKKLIRKPVYRSSLLSSFGWCKGIAR